MRSGLVGTGAVAWPYKIAVVAVMALVACGTLVTFGSAGAETPSTTQAAPLPGSDEASPTVEGQVLPPSSAALLNSADLLSTLNLTDYSPGDTDLFSLSDDDEDSDDEDSDEDTKSDIAKKLAAASAEPTSSPTSDKPTSEPTNAQTSEPTEEPEPVEGPRHKAWADKKAEYEECLDTDGKTLLGCNLNPGLPGSEPSFTS